MLKHIRILLFIHLFSIHLQSQPYYFRHYSVENGLSHNTVLCSIQDSKGFLWFGTKDGLNRFDGYNFKTFQKTTGKKGSIGNDHIHALYEDRLGTLWVGTEKGLYQYQRKTEEFKLIEATANAYIHKINEDRKGNLWFISNFALSKYNKKTARLTNYDTEKYFVATSMCTSEDGTVWAGTPEGLLKKYNPEEDSFLSFDLFHHSGPVNSKWVESVFPSSSGHILAGTANSEIKVFDPLNATYTDITLPYKKNAHLYIRTIQQTGPDEFWLGTEVGVFVYNKKTGSSVHLSKDYYDPLSLNDNAIYTICKDREGGVWLGTYFGGINYLPNHHTPFLKYYPQKGKNALSGNVVREIQKDQYGNIWIGTEDAGLNKLNPSTGKFTYFMPGKANGNISFFNIHGLLATGNELWIGTFLHGIDVMDIRTGKVIRHYNAGTQSGLTHDFIYCFYQLRSGKILVGTPHGIFVFVKEKNIFEPIQKMPFWTFYTSIMEDDTGTIWASSFGKGVQYYNPRTGQAGSYTYNDKDSFSLSSDRVNYIFKDSQSRLWFATEEGLCKWEPTTGRFIRYSTDNGFPNNFMLTIAEDDNHYLWVSTTKGLARFHPPSGKVQAYYVSNGLLSDQFNYNSALKDADGHLYFGSVKGMISFDPKKFDKTSFVPPVYITGLQVNNQELPINFNNSPLKQSITYTNEITLAHNQSSISINFSALNYTVPETIQYSYQMQGLSSKWINLKTNRKVYFTELPSGSYTFRIKASDSDGVWNERETKLIIRILPPWWASVWAYLLYALLIILLVYFIVRFYHQRLEEKNRRKLTLLKIEKEKEILQVELGKEKEILQAKIDFFTNIAHEIRTPLTLIKVPLEKVIAKAGKIPDIENSLKIMDRNTNRLINLTNQLLDFRQVEKSRFHLSFEKAEINALVKEAGASFSLLAETTNITLQVSVPAASVFAYVDVDAFNKIIYNLISNAVKYALNKVHIELQQQDNDSFTIVIKNDGYLIPDSLKEKIFEPFYRIRETEAQTGSGIGLALSRSLAQLHNGHLALQPPDGELNVFSLTLPINQLTNANAVLQ